MNESPTLASTRLLMGFKALALIDRQVAGGRHDGRGPGRAGNEDCAANAQSAYKTAAFCHAVPPDTAPASMPLVYL